MKSNIPPFLFEKKKLTPSASGKKAHLSLVDRSIKEFAGVIQSGFTQWETASKKGLLQYIDPRVKLVFMISFLIIISIKKDIQSELFISAFTFSMALLSNLNIYRLYKNIFLLTFFFGFLISFPSAFNIITGGEMLFPIIRLDADYTFWIYKIPSTIGLTREGIETASLLILRVFNSISLSFLIINTTQFFELMKSLSMMKVPDALIMIITLSYKYIFILSKTVEDMYLGLKSRLAVEIKSSEMRKIVTGRMAFIFKKSWRKYDALYRAMLARGFSGELKFYNFKKLTATDYAFSAFILCAAILFIRIGK